MIKPSNLEATDFSRTSGEEPSYWSTSLGGCGYVLGILTLTVVMLIVNAIVCLSVHSALISFGPSQIVQNPGLAPYLGQLFFFLMPVLLTVLQWNLLDRLNQIFRRK